MSQTLERLNVKSKFTQESGHESVVELCDATIDQKLQLELIRTFNGQELSLYKQIFSPKPVVTEEYPIPMDSFKWYWDSNRAFSYDGVYPSKLPHPEDPVVLFSNASSVKNHTIRNGFCEINSGGGNGRIYLELYRIPAYTEDELVAQKFTKNLILMTNFVLSPKSANLSIKYGNHGTTGFLYDKDTDFGGFGQAEGKTDIQSKAEWNHDLSEGNEERFKYPNKIQLKSNTEYKMFTAYISNEQLNEMVVNTWMMFDIEGEKKWYHVMNDRKWSNDSDWQKGVNGMKKSKDKTEALKGPAFIHNFHVWLRANAAMVKIRNTYLGTVI